MLVHRHNIELTDEEIWAAYDLVAAKAEAFERAALETEGSFSSLKVTRDLLEKLRATLKGET